MNEKKLLEQKRKIIALFKQHKLYAYFRVTVNVMAILAYFDTDIDKFPRLLSESKEKTHIGQLTQQDTETLLQFITQILKPKILQTSLKKENEIINPFTDTPFTDTVAKQPIALYFSTQYKRLELLYTIKN